MYSSLRPPMPRHIPLPSPSDLRSPAAYPYPHPPTSDAPPHTPTLTLRSSQYARDWQCETVPLQVSYARQDSTPSSANLPVILYIQQPWFLMHSLSGAKLAMPSKTGCPSTLTLCTRRPCVCCFQSRERCQLYLARPDASLHLPCVPGDLLDSGPFGRWRG